MLRVQQLLAAGLGARKPGVEPGCAPQPIGHAAAHKVLHPAPGEDEAEALARDAAAHGVHEEQPARVHDQGRALRLVLDHADGRQRHGFAVGRVDGGHLPEALQLVVAAAKGGGPLHEIVGAPLDHELHRALAVSSSVDLAVAAQGDRVLCEQPGSQGD